MLCSKKDLDDIYLIFKFFVAVGIPFPGDMNSKSKLVFEKLMYIYLNIVSVYIPILKAYHIFEGGNMKHSMVLIALNIIVIVLRLYLIRRGKNILASFCSLHKLRSMSVTSSRKKFGRWIAISSSFSYFAAIAVTISSFCKNFKYSKKMTKRLMFGYNVPGIYQGYFMAASVTIWLGENLILFVVPFMTTVLLCYVYHSLGNLISDYKNEVQIRHYNTTLTQNSIRRLVADLRNISITVTGVDKEISPATMLLLSSFVSQILLFTSTLSKGSVNLFQKIMVSCLVVLLLAALFVTVILAAQIRERFIEIKDIVSDSAVSRECIFNDVSLGVNHIALQQMIDGLVSKTHMTAMGVFKIEKSIILTVLCAFISYSALLTQVLNE